MQEYTPQNSFCVTELIQNSNLKNFPRAAEFLSSPFRNFCYITESIRICYLVGQLELKSSCQMGGKSPIGLHLFNNIVFFSTETATSRVRDPFESPYKIEILKKKKLSLSSNMDLNPTFQPKCFLTHPLLLVKLLEKRRGNYASFFFSSICYFTSCLTFHQITNPVTYSPIEIKNVGN